MRYITLTFLAAISLGLATTAGALTASQQVEKETVITNPDGTETIVREAAEMVVPGERIIYTLNYTNDEDDDASNLVLTMPVPAAVTYIDGTAGTMGAVVTYSADGGKSFADRNMVKTAGLNGELVTASAADITHVRWLVKGPVTSGQTGALSFTGVLR